MSALKMQNVLTIEALADVVSDLVSRESGNVLDMKQRPMVISRLKKRLLDLGDLTAPEYAAHFEAHRDTEMAYLLGLLTTHHTFFFREFKHFEFLLAQLPELVRRAKARGDQKLRILSAACSRGQEVYSLAVFMEVHLRAYPGISYEILGTDIDPESVKVARNGVYPYNEIKSIPQVYIEGNFQRGVGDIARFVRLKDHVKKNCSFTAMNLLALDSELRGKKFDVIFCRNVFIYFDAPTITKIVKDFKAYLTPGGYFITGLSESLKAIDVPKQTLAASVYCFDAPVASGETQPALVTAVSAPVARIPKPLRVLIVDDSPSIVKLLTKIFSEDPDFAVAGVATNGLEAEEFLRTQTVDALTLDIHMPEMDGVSYLKKNYRRGHPKVVVVSSASRDDARFAQEALKSGASDFVEKPALNNLADRAEEIKNKLKMAFLTEAPVRTSLDGAFARSYTIKSPEDKLLCLVACYGDKRKLAATFAELRGERPPTFVFLEGNANFLEVLRDEFAGLGKVVVYQPGTVLEKGTIYLADFAQHFGDLRKQAAARKRSSLCVYGIVSPALERQLLEGGFGQVLIEDIAGLNARLKEVVTDLFPATSFSHLATEFLAGD